MTVLNYSDETFTVMVTVGENIDAVPAIVDTALGFVVVETNQCSACAATKKDVTGAGMSESSNPINGVYNNPSGTYSGNTGQATFCMYKTGDYTTIPDSANVASMPCIQNANVHWANVVSAPNQYANVHIGAALGLGPDRQQVTPDATYRFME